MEKQKVLVTGGVGYIGSHTVVELIQSGFEVVIIDNLSNSSADVLNGIEKITGVRPLLEIFDLQNQPLVNDFFARHSPIDAVIHFAASKAVGESVEKPELYYRNNLISLLNILEAQDKYNVPNMVFSSSCTVYGQPEELPVTENAPVQPATSPYGNTKQISEEMIRDFINAHPGVQAIALRYFNPIGAHASAQIGELPRGVPNNLVPYITQTGIGLREEVKVFGGDYDTPDGSCIRDYIHVVDLAKAHLIAIQRLMDGKSRDGFEMFNVGTGKGVSVLELISIFIQVSGVPLRYSIVDRRPGDIEQIWADPTLANRELGWKAQSSLEETILSAWKWELQYEMEHPRRK